MKRKVMVPIVIVALIALDQWVKFEIVKNIQLGEVKSFIPKILSLTYLRNTGAAFSILENQQWLFAVITLVVLVQLFGICASISKALSGCCLA